MGRETDTVAWFASLASAPYRHDFYQTLRRLECIYQGSPRWGRGRRPVDEPVRLGQEADLSFAPSPLASFDPGRDGRPPRLQVHLFGLLGPNGPLPLHITEFARERIRHEGDATLSRFLDLLQHRLMALFYRAWAQGQPHVNHDRPSDDRFGTYLGAFIGLAPPSFRNRDRVPDLAKLFHAGTLMRQARNAEGLAAIVRHFFGVRAMVQEFVGHWLPLGTRERTRLGDEGARLGSSAVLGSRVWDRQCGCRIVLGPLTLAEYQAFLPGGSRLQQLVGWVRTYLSFELTWDVRLLLASGEVPRCTLGGGQRLGWTTWLGRRKASGDAGDLRLNAEAWADSAGVAGA
jgi:type VI secretion system protein ImpH